MAQPKLTKLELQILEVLWSHGKASIREIQEGFPAPRPVRGWVSSAWRYLSQCSQG